MSSHWNHSIINAVWGLIFKQHFKIFGLKAVVAVLELILMTFPLTTITITSHLSDANRKNIISWAYKEGWGSAKTLNINTQKYRNEFFYSCGHCEEDEKKISAECARVISLKIAADFNCSIFCVCEIYSKYRNLINLSIEIIEPCTLLKWTRGGFWLHFHAFLFLFFFLFFARDKRRVWCRSSRRALHLFKSLSLTLYSLAYSLTHLKVSGSLLKGKRLCKKKKKSKCISQNYRLPSL